MKGLPFNGEALEATERRLERLLTRHDYLVKLQEDAAVGGRETPHLDDQICALEDVIDRLELRLERLERAWRRT